MTDQPTPSIPDPEACLHDGYHAHGTCPEAKVEFARQRAIALRALADLIEAKPELAGDPYTEIRLDIWLDDADELARLTRQLGGARSKVALSSMLVVRRDFGARVRLDLNAERDQVCEAVVVGTETVIVDEVVQPAVTRPVEQQRDIIEWRCAPVLEHQAVPA